MDIDALASMLIAKDSKELDYDIFYGRKKESDSIKVEITG